MLVYLQTLSCLSFVMYRLQVFLICKSFVLQIRKKNLITWLSCWMDSKLCFLSIFKGSFEPSINIELNIPYHAYVIILSIYQNLPALVERFISKIHRNCGSHLLANCMPSEDHYCRLNFLFIFYLQNNKLKRKNWSTLSSYGRNSW